MLSVEWFSEEDCGGSLGGEGEDHGSVRGKIAGACGGVGGEGGSAFRECESGSSARGNGGSAFADTAGESPVEKTHSPAAPGNPRRWPGLRK